MFLDSVLLLPNSRDTSSLEHVKSIEKDAF